MTSGTAGGRAERAKATDGYGTVRLLAAFAVIVDHAAELTGSGGSVLPSRFGVDLGAVAVAVFMAMSGYLVIQSWIRDPSVWRFTVRRALRIVPGLAVVLLLSATVLGPVFTTMPVSDYFQAGPTWQYIWHNLELFPQQYALPGVFTDNPYPNVVNGSLWSIPVEVLGYGGVALLGLLGVAKKRRYLAIVVVLVLGALLQRILTNQVDLPSTLLLTPTLPLIQYLAIYGVSVAMYTYREHVRFSWAGVAVALGVEVVMYASATTEVTRLVTVPYLALALASLMPRRLWVPQSVGMASYGIYLYGFPTEQVVVHFGARSTVLVALLSLPIAFVLGMLSWHIVEKPCMNLRSKIFRASLERSRRKEQEELVNAQTVVIPVVEPVVEPAVETSGPR
ncbi:acyltransferase family protein [Labedaea rhizosphaerae]|uniref:Peptidoglycan/LPS O-acetylase OafA/YrhL n=1 Tax=Labedaea rhizosphaerae TaxID=598644 RepID=A0A4V3D0B2_LABRH|nr:acyltransferase [Labedaea rhizosphaerae]TDQ05095.1 peptidoglycan/LPS O-acetylase OafA/YrhL [Labedaea rhizosphaerae]